MAHATSLSYLKQAVNYSFEGCTGFEIFFWIFSDIFWDFSGFFSYSMYSPLEPMLERK